MKKGEVQVKKTYIKKVLFTLFICIVSSSVFAQKHADQKKSKKDTERDVIYSIAHKIQKMVIKSTTVENKTTSLLDYNGDGKADAEFTILGAKLFSEKVDFNKDGKFDRQTWNYATGEVISTTTEDTNLDGKVDFKIVKTYKDAKPGHYVLIEYKDKNFDGTFDTKKTTQVELYQGMGTGRNVTGPGEICINCATGEYQNAHLPRILDQDAERHMRLFLQSENGNPGLLASLKENGIFKFKVHIQEDCYGPKFRPFFDKEGPAPSQQYPKLIKDSLETGMACMEELAYDAAPSHATKATNNLVNAVGGLIGYGFLKLKPGSQDDYVYDHHHGQRLSFICNAVDANISPPLSWGDNSSNMSAQIGGSANAASRTVFARGTIAREGDLNRHLNNVGGKYAAPNIVINPNIAKILNDDSVWKKEFNGQDRVEKFKEMIFHEYLHTSLGTAHTPDESKVDYAETCGDYCFHDPAGGDAIGNEIKRISGEICSGMHSSADPMYKQKMKRLKCLKKKKEQTPNQLINTLPPERPEDFGGCPPAPEGPPMAS